MVGGSEKKGEGMGEGKIGRWGVREMGSGDQVCLIEGGDRGEGAIEFLAEVV